MIDIVEHLIDLKALLMYFGTVDFSFTAFIVKQQWFFVKTNVNISPQISLSIRSCPTNLISQVIIAKNVQINCWFLNPPPLFFICESDVMQLKKIAIVAAIVSTVAFVGCTKKADETTTATTTTTTEATAPAVVEASAPAMTEASAPVTTDSTTTTTTTAS